MSVVSGCGPETDRTSLPPLKVVTDQRIDAPLRHATEEELQRFIEGDALFDLLYREPDGLGPLYIRAACASCHENGANGPGVVQKMALPRNGTVPVEDESALPYGTTVRPLLTSGATTPLVPPAQGPSLVLELRIGPSIFGRGYMEAIADSEIERVANEQSAAAGPISGRIHRVTFGSEANPGQPYHAYSRGQPNLIGRFGFKARVATLDDFTADAFQGDMGMTSPMRPFELPNPDGLSDDARPGIDVSLETVQSVTEYVRLLEIPHRPALDAEGERGRELFEASGCASCHVPSMRTRSDYPIQALADIDAPIFSDLLLHDMGEGLADGLGDGEAEAREWRTAPLMGLRLLRSYLHDGRAKTLEQAILFHQSEGSEANGSVESFQALPESDRRALLRYLRSL